MKERFDARHRMGTFFDGLITNDGRQSEVYKVSRVLLSAAFGVDGRTVAAE